MYRPIVTLIPQRCEQPRRKVSAASEASALMFCFSRFFPPASDTSASSEANQDEPLENTADPEILGKQASTSSATGASQHEDWVTVEKPSTKVGSSQTLATNKEDQEGPGTRDGAQNTAITSNPKAETDQDGDHVPNSLLKDW